MLSVYYFLIVFVGLLWTHGDALKGVDYGQPSQSKGLTEDEKTHILDLHNKYREVTANGKFFGKPKAANMLKMHWDPKAAKHAQEWADNCGGGAHGNHPNEGQNYAGAWPAKGIFKSAFTGWNDNEAPLWRWSGGRSGATSYFSVGAGHYSQVVWAKTNGVGCGFNECSGSMARFICNYSPPGNYNGAVPYIDGKPCSKCPSGYGCDNGLCSKGGSSRPNKKKPNKTQPKKKKPKKKKPNKNCVDSFDGCSGITEFCSSLSGICDKTCDLC